MVKSGGRQGEQRAPDCGPTLVGFGVDSPSKSRVTTTSKERERTDRQRTSPLFFLERRVWIAVRSVVPMRFVWDGSTGRIRCGRHRKVGSLLASRSSSPSSSPLQPDRAGRRRHPHDQSERSSDEDEKSWLFQGGVVGRGVGGMSGKLAGRQDELLRALKTSF